MAAWRNLWRNYQRNRGVFSPVTHVKNVLFGSLFSVIGSLDLASSCFHFNIYWNINYNILPSAKETMHEHDEELEIYDNAFKNYF